jgi:uncharacterized membrane protein (GlpM family)
LSEAPASGRIVIKAFAWFFGALSMLALLSPLGASQDEAFHARSIWCGHGERRVICDDLFRNEFGILVAQTPLEVDDCHAEANVPLVCVNNQDGGSIWRTNYGLYPELFYFVLSWFVVPSVEISTLMVRLASILFVTTFLGICTWLLPPRHRFVLLMVCLSTFTGAGFFLFSSMNPSSWTAIGVGVGWLAIHAAATNSELLVSRRWALYAVGIVGSVMAAGSRWDAIPFLGFTLFMTAFHALWVRYPHFRTRLIVFGPALSVALVAIFEIFAPYELHFDVMRLFRFVEGQRDNVVFISDNLLNGIPNALGVLGSVPTRSPLPLPGATQTVALSLLVVFLIRSYRRGSITQLFGVFVTFVVVALVIAAQVALEDARDSGGVEPRYVYPLFIFGVSWWYLMGRDDLVAHAKGSLRPAAITTTILFFLVSFTVAERFVDRQSAGLRYIPEGLDQWWWTWVPFGPNVAVLLGPLFIWKFFEELCSLVSGDASKENRVL